MVINQINKMWLLYMGVKSDPVRYLGAPDLERLEAFWHGTALYFSRAEGDGYDRLPGFRDFLVEKYYANPGGAHGFAQVLWLNCKDQKEAFYRFYELLEDFLKIQGESYQPFRPCNLKGTISVIEGGPTRVIWEMVNNHRTIRIGLGRRSLSLLEAYLNGVVQCVACLEDKEYELLPCFGEYLREKFQMQEEMHYYQIVRKFSADDEAAFNNFYTWMQDFLETRGLDYEPVIEKINLR